MTTRSGRKMPVAFAGVQSAKFDDDEKFVQNSSAGYQWQVEANE
ncbi:MAG TPA: hypothetical protein VFC37_01645 [Terracidiphilus sp.]|nr:hypothetical protein [Terracidiphilus sp.]